VKKAKKAKQGTANRPNSRKTALAPRWRTSGLVKKDQLERVLEGNGAHRITA
jgi:hypothetical protein